MVDPHKPDYSNTPVNPNRPRYHYQLVELSLKPIVSIVTPFYNTGPIFQETAFSILQQSLQQFEWIIVNDGSYEAESLTILEHYRGLDPRIKVIDQPSNLGLPAARNTGFHQAQCKYILFIDSDDLLEPTAAEKWLWFLEGHPEYAFVGGYSVGFGAHEYLWQSGFQDMEANLAQNRINHVVMVRKKVLEAVGGYDEDLRNGLEDWEFWLRCASLGFWGNSISEYLHWYRTRSQHTDRWADLREDQLKALQEKFKSRYPTLWNGGFPHPQSSVDLQLLQITDEPLYTNQFQKNNPRLLLIAPWMVMGGAEKFNLALTRQLIIRGWEVTIITTAPSNDPWQHEFESIIPDVFSLNHFIEWRDYPRFINTIIHTRKIDAILVSASHEAYRLLPYLRAQFPQIPILDFLHMVTPDWMNGGFPRLSIIFQSYLDLSITSCQQVKNWMISEGDKADHIAVSTINVDTDLFHPDIQKREEIRARLGIHMEDAVILYIGRIEQQKQPRVFLQTCLRLDQENLPFTCLVIGDGSMKPWLEEMVAKENLREKVIFMAGIAPDRMHEWMASGDIIFMPSENEGISLTFYEGMACGLVPVGANVGGQSELVTQDCGFLIERGSEEYEIERYSHILIDLIQSSEKRERMSHACRQRVTQYFRLEQMGSRIEELLTTAKDLRFNHPKNPDNQETSQLLARQAVEYMRAFKAYQDAKQEEIRLGKMVSDYTRLLVNPPMPPAPARTYLYFAARQFLYPIFRSRMKYRWFTKIHTFIKRIMTTATHHD